jgi:ribosomal protein L11 methyltransferase
MTWKKIKCQLLYKDIGKCEEFFLNNISDQICYYELESKTIDSEPDDLWLFEAYVQNDKTLLPNVVDLNLLSIEQEELTDESWISYLDYIPEPIILKDFYVYKDLLPEQKKIPIILNSSMAFGTGEHGSTQGCLEAIANLKFAEIKSVLDIGTGSGILSVAASKIFPSAQIIGTDIDEDAVKIAKNHGQLNNIDAHFLSVTAFDEIYIDKKIDLIIANIFANTLIELYEYIINKNPKYIIMAGFFKEQVPKIMEVYNNHYIINFEIIINDWITLSLKRK